MSIPIAGGWYLATNMCAFMVSVWEQNKRAQKKCIPKNRSAIDESEGCDAKVYLLLLEISGNRNPQKIWAKMSYPILLSIVNFRLGKQHITDSAIPSYTKLQSNLTTWGVIFSFGGCWKVMPSINEKFLLVRIGLGRWLVYHRPHHWPVVSKWLYLVNLVWYTIIYHHFPLACSFKPLYFHQRNQSG